MEDVTRLIIESDRDGVLTVYSMKGEVIEEKDQVLNELFALTELRLTMEKLSGLDVVREEKDILDNLEQFSLNYIAELKELESANQEMLLRLASQDTEEDLRSISSPTSL